VKQNNYLYIVFLVIEMVHYVQLAYTYLRRSGYKIISTNVSLTATKINTGHKQKLSSDKGNQAGEGVGNWSCFP
jgi:hypothetical protein